MSKAAISHAILCAVAWATGWAVYMFIMGATVYDGLLSLVSQAFIGAILSGVSVLACMAVGILLWLPYVGPLWKKHRWIAATLAIAGLTMVVYSITPSQMTEYTAGLKVFREAGLTCLPGYVMLVFAIVNLPRKEPHGIAACNMSAERKYAP